MMRIKSYFNVMKGFIFLYFCLPMVVYAGSLIVLNHNNINFSEIYYCSLRTMFFTAFLTAGSFMLSFMSIVLFTFSSKLFDDAEYIRVFKKIKEVFGTKKNFYSPLINLGKVFMICVWSCIITSVSQVTLGYIEGYAWVIVCISLACTTFSLIFFLLYYFSINLLDWFTLLEEKGKDI